MKRIFTFSLAAALCAAATAEELKVLSCGLGIPGKDEPQLMLLSISPNGKYACGAIEIGDGVFIANLETNEVKFNVPDLLDDDGTSLRRVDNNGLSIGFCADYALMWQFEDAMPYYLFGMEGTRGLLGEALTNDGSMLVGSILESDTNAAFSTDGGEVWNRLPMPPEEEVLKLLKVMPQISSAKRVSGDGKVILGCVGSFTLPCLWLMNDEGEFVPDLFPVRYVKLSEADLDNDERPLVGLSASYIALSNNGRYVAFLGIIIKNGQDTLVPVVYDIQTKSLNVYSETQEIDVTGEGLYPSAVSDDGTFIGTIGMPLHGSFGSFIMKAGETQAETFSDAFPEFLERYGQSDFYGFNCPTAMSADGRYISGYTFYSDDYYDQSTPGYYESYVIDRGAEVGAVDRLTYDSKNHQAIYSIDGRSMRGLTKGLNIVRNADGTVSKILKK
ncbi:MAG: hypothetical protein K2N48_02205 [Muribaculaceae bacterium]|nr:hypothetical protein [Muribaculaceae bacterium]